MKIRSFARKTIALALLSVAATGANAATDLGPVSVGAPLSFNAFASGGPFLDLFTFILPANSGSGYSLIAFDFKPFFATDLLAFVLVSNADSLVKGIDIDVDDNNKLDFSVGSLPAGSYSLGVLGSTLGQFGGLYNGAISVTAVPEPESYALFLAGLGIMGAVARRRNKAKSL